MGRVSFLTTKQFGKKFPGAKPGVIAPGRPRPEWRNPVQFQLREPEWLVCHGFSLASASGFAAWLERGGFVLDLSGISDAAYYSIVVGRATKAARAAFVEANKIPRREFYKRKQISGVRRFEKEAVRSALDLNRTYGPWREL